MNRLEQRFNSDTMDILRAHPLWTLTHTEAWRGADLLVRQGFLMPEHAEQIKHEITINYDPDRDQWLDLLNPQSEEVLEHDRLMHEEQDRDLSLIEKNSDFSLSQIATRKLNSGRNRMANKILKKLNVSLKEIHPPFEIFIVDKDEDWWWKNLGLDDRTVGFGLPNPRKRRAMGFWKNFKEI